MREKGFFQRIYGYVRSVHPETHIYLYIALVILGIIWYALYTSYMLERLTTYSKASTQAHAEMVSDVLFSDLSQYRKHSIIQGIVEDFDMPIIFTDEYGEPHIWWNIYRRKGLFQREKIAYDDDSYETIQYLRQKVREFENTYAPKLVYAGNSATRMGWLYFSDSTFLSGVRLLPFFEVFFVLIIILAIYIVLKSILFSERRSLWIGLAKETAHQMGTPITSLLGWIEYLKLESTSYESDFTLDYDTMEEDSFPNKVNDIASDMERDIARLRKVANRFELIGSKPSLRPSCLRKLLEDHGAYFSRRVPVFGRKVNVAVDIKNDLPPVLLNSDLLSWVFENLFKNSLDAMDKAEGEIYISAEHVKVDRVVIVRHRDNGCGVGKDKRNTVFSPGYTTKRRGWGLGLALARRIIQTYHKGKIYISWTKKGEGTEIVIELPVAPQAKKGAVHADEA
ncbi:sensor histidine kinase [Chitinivibrio alkaliphilus]|uniref:histidine kinase n=1 Tax=Chitinivibrio alkaliphilus ACht1 TaxID=1313304 RepID=U7DBC7_9BACT|nr:HAMP domain-containing sensor histidine kinase [Chitinivibrio alkaliphilus]ERP38863.1 histidine kinase [Chitinivibrio alkaliphilus ACht1]